jgi:hypothetical protein
LYRTARLRIAFVPASPYARGYGAPNSRKRQESQQAGTNVQGTGTLATFALDFDVEATG